MTSWTTTTLDDEDLFEFLSGLWKGKKPPFEKAVVIRNTNFRNDGRLDLTDAAVLEVEQRRLAERVLRGGDIIIERSGGGPKQPVGRVCLFEAAGPLPFSFSNFTSVLRLRRPDLLLPRFVLYSLLHHYYNGFTVPLQRATTGIRNLDFEAYRQVLIPVPPIEVQERIVSVLGRLQQALGVEESIVVTASELRREAASDLLCRGIHREDSKETEIGILPQSWDVQPLEELREFLQYGTSVKCSFVPEGNPVLRIPNVVQGQIDGRNLKWCKLPDSTVDSLLLTEGDILFVRTNGVRERAGACAVYMGQPERSLFASYLIRARVKRDRLNPQFFQYYTATPRGNAFLAGRASPAADGKFNINTKTIDSILVPVPSPREQAEIVTALQTIDEYLEVHDRRRSLLEGLFVAVLDKVMTGRVRIEDLKITTPDVAAA